MIKLLCNHIIDAKFTLTTDKFMSENLPKLLPGSSLNHIFNNVVVTTLTLT